MNPSDAEELPPRIHVLNSVAEVDKIISDYQIEARSAFIVFNKDKSFGSSGKLKLEVLAPLTSIFDKFVGLDDSFFFL